VGCVGCGSAAVSERSDLTGVGYRRFRCRTCGKQFNGRSAGSLNRTLYPSDVIALVVLWRLRCKLALRDLPAMFLICDMVFSHGIGMALHRTDGAGQRTGSLVAR
jgi:putative transposase